MQTAVTSLSPVLAGALAQGRDEKWDQLASSSHSHQAETGMDGT